MTGFDRLHVSGSDRSKHIKCAPTGHPALALGGQPREECAPSDQARKDTRGADLSPRLRRARGSPAEISRAAVAPWACGELVLLVNHGVASAGLTTDGVCQFCSANPREVIFKIFLRSQSGFIHPALTYGYTCFFCKCFSITLGIRHGSRETPISLCVWAIS